MWGRVTIFLTRLQGNQEIWRVNVWRLKCVISKYHEIHLQCTILTIKVVYLFWCFWCFGGLCEEHSPPGPGLPVSLALGQHHGILCQAVGVHAVWICLDSTFEIQEQSQPTNQPTKSIPFWAMGNKTCRRSVLPETVAAVGICRCFEKNFDNLLSLQQKSPKSPPHSFKPVIGI